MVGKEDPLQDPHGTKAALAGEDPMAMTEVAEGVDTPEDTAEDSLAIPSETVAVVVLITREQTSKTKAE